MTVIVELALAGVAIGCVAALAGLGIVATYRVTGVVNLAFGAIAMFCAYLLWQAVRVWHVPLWLAALLVLGIVAPGIGLILQAGVFYPLRVREAGVAEHLVATIGVFVLLVGIAYLAWGPQARIDSPSILPAGSIRLHGQIMLRNDTLTELCVLVALVAGLWVLLRLTRFGLALRAVMDRRDVTPLMGIDPVRFDAFGWMFSSFLAGLCGVLLAPSLRLDPYGLTLVMLETTGVAVVARLSSGTVAVLVAIATGIGQSELTRAHLTGTWQSLVQAVQSNLFVVVLGIGVFFVLPKPTWAGRDPEPAVNPVQLAGRHDRPDLWWGAGVTVTLLLPLAFGAADLRNALTVPALAMLYLSLVLVTGYGGQISLGQAGFAGLGALAVARLGGDLHVPWLLALGGGALGVGMAAWLVGGRVVRRSGAALALATFAVGVMVSRFVLEQPAVTNNIKLSRPGGFTGDHAFYVLEIVIVGGAALLVRTVGGGRTGRALRAVADDELAAATSGVDSERLKLAVFGLAAGLAALSGGMTILADRSFDAGAFDPITGLVAFAAVVVFGAASPAAAVIGAAAVTALELGVAAGASTLAIGIGAVLLGRFPGGLASGVHSAVRWFLPPPLPPRTPRDVRLTPYGEEVRARIQRAKSPYGA